MNRISLSPMLLASLLPLSLALSAPANAVFHSDGANATGPCNGALPGYEGALRKRPLALRNEGSSNAFVSCSMQSDGGENPGYDSALITFVNRNASSAAIDCTMVAGIVAELGEEAPTFYPQTIGIPANTAGVMTWEPADFELQIFDNWLNFTCNLPPGVEMALVGGTYQSP